MQGKIPCCTECYQAQKKTDNHSRFLLSSGLCIFTLYKGREVKKLISDSTQFQRITFFHPYKKLRHITQNKVHVFCSRKLTVLCAQL